MTEADQDADALVNHVSHMCVPGQVSVKKNSRIFCSKALLNGLPTDPYADRREVAGILFGT